MLFKKIINRNLAQINHENWFVSNHIPTFKFNFDLIHIIGWIAARSRIVLRDNYVPLSDRS